MSIKVVLYEKNRCESFNGSIFENRYFDIAHRGFKIRIFSPCLNFNSKNVTSTPSRNIENPGKD